VNDRRFERWIALLLRTGVAIAAAIVLIGGAGHLVQFGEKPAEYHSFQGEPAQYTSGAAILAGAAHLDWLAVIQLGLLVLIATPVARVAFSIAAFVMERDWIYVAITVLVLAILLYSLL